MGRKTTGHTLPPKRRGRVKQSAVNTRKLAALLVAGATMFITVVGLTVWARISFRKPFPTEPVTATNHEVRIPLSALSSGRAKFYHIELQGGPKVRFFVVRQPADAPVHVALDAGQNSFEAGMGYGQDGSDMICRGCGARIPIARLDGPVDGCTPIPIPHHTKGDQLVLRENDLTKYAGLFQLRRQGMAGAAYRDAGAATTSNPADGARTGFAGPHSLRNSHRLAR